MAIYWVDPYLNSPNGGIHGTTSSGGGTYASPWTFADLVNTTKMGALVSGDEIRLKGLAEDTFFNQQVAFTSVIGSGSTISSYQLSAASDGKLIRLKAVDGSIYYSCNSTNYWSDLRTTYGTSTWRSANPLQFPGYGYYTCNPNYYITTGPGSGYLFDGLVAPVTVTSGWTSETVRDGVTVIVANDTTPFGSHFYFGPQQYSTAQRMLTLDCPELILGTLSGGVALTLCSNSIKIKYVGISEYHPAGYLYVYSGGNGSTTAGTGTLEIGSISTGSWCYVYSYGAGTTNVSIGVSTVGYQPQFQLQAASGTPTFNFSFKIWHFYGYPQLQMGPYNVNWNNPAGWSYEWQQGGPISGFSSATIVENFGTPAAQMFTGTQYNSFAYVQVPSQSQSPTSPQDITFFSTAGSYLKKASFAIGKMFIRRLLIETPSENIDTMSTTPASCSVASPYGSPYKCNIMYENVTKKRVQVISATSTGDCAVVFQSPANSDKLTWRLFGSGNGKVYADSFALPLPTYGAGGVGFAASFTTTSTPGITLLVKLYGINTSTGSLYSFPNPTVTVSGTSITVASTLTQSQLTTNNIGNIFAVVDVTKTSTANCSLVFNSMTTTAL